jgi:hypothetical protein
MDLTQPDRILDRADAFIDHDGCPESWVSRADASKFQRAMAVRS